MENTEEISPRDREFLRRTIELAREAKSAGNPPFGSILMAMDGTILADMVNTTVTDQDLSAHPELKLAVWAARNLSREQARTTTMYTSTEPCAMCSGAFAHAGLGRLVFAVSGAEAPELRRGTEVRPSPTTSSRSILGQASYPITVLGPVPFDQARAVFAGDLDE